MNSCGENALAGCVIPPDIISLERLLARGFSLHRFLQNYVKDFLHLSPSSLERPFPTIRRIADIVWEEKKCIFEVQYSPIPKEEVLRRVQDYALLGYQVVWLLSDHLFNRRRARLAEKTLREAGAYFFHVDSRGNVTIYDQLESWWEGRRILRGERVSVDLRKLQKNGQGKYRFYGDWRGEFLPAQEILFGKWQALEKEKLAREKRRRVARFFRKVIEIYESWLLQRI